MTRSLSSVGMAMMNVRIVRVAVFETFVTMRMGMGFAGRIARHMTSSHSQAVVSLSRKVGGVVSGRGFSQADPESVCKKTPARWSP